MTHLLSPVYPFLPAEADIELYRGPGTLWDQPIGEVRVWASMHREIAVRWEVVDSELFGSLDDTDLTIEHPAYGSCTLPARVHNGAGSGSVLPVEVGSGGPIARLVCHWANLPQILPGEPLPHDGGGWWRGRWKMTAGNWNLTVDSRPDIHDVLASRRKTDEEFVLTHTGELTTVDGSTFDPADSLEVLFAVQLALSFALGRWVAPTCPVGFDASGNRVVEQWAPWRCDPWRGNFHWWHDQRDEDLSDFVSRFVCAYLDPIARPAARHLAVHAISGNHDGTTTEGRLMLAQAGLEYLAWIDLVVSGRYTKQEFKNLGAASKLSLLLKPASIPTAIPEELDALKALSDAKGGKKGWDAPNALVWVRNRLVHPKDPSEPYEIKQLIWQATQLQLEYLELLLLHRLGYSGTYLHRYPPGGWPTPIPVPWATRDPD